MFQLRAFELALAFAFTFALALAFALVFAARLAFGFSLAFSPPPHAVARASAALAKIARSVFLLISSPVSSWSVPRSTARTRERARLCVRTDEGHARMALAALGF